MIVHIVKFMVGVVHTPRSFYSVVDWSTVLELKANVLYFTIRYVTVN